MRLLPIFIALVLLGHNKKGQNLVQNPGYEAFTGCPTGFNQVSYAVGWSSYHDSPDYFNSCGWSGVGAPSNNHGYQVPHTGNAYCGLITYNKAAGFYREVIGSPLTAPLITGQKYYISFYTSLTIKAPNNAYASSKIGVKFTKSAYVAGSNEIPISNFAHVYANTLITDTANWTKIFGSFVADSNYQYIAIGNFFNDTNTDTMRFIGGPLPIYAYYYVDDVCVSTDSLYAENWTGVSEKAAAVSVDVYPNPFSVDAELIVGPTRKSSDGILSVFDMTGCLVKRIMHLDSNKITIRRDNLPNGLYFFRLSDGGLVLSRGKFIIVD
jgi:hypothetical protein